MSAERKIPDATVTIRLPADLAEFVDRMAEQQFNNRSGIMRMAVAKLRDSMPAAEPAESNEAQPPVLMAG